MMTQELVVTHRRAPQTRWFPLAAATMVWNLFSIALPCSAGIQPPPTSFGTLRSAQENPPVTRSVAAEGFVPITKPAAQDAGLGRSNLDSAADGNNSGTSAWTDNSLRQSSEGANPSKWLTSEPPIPQHDADHTLVRQQPQRDSATTANVSEPSHVRPVNYETTESALTANEGNHSLPNGLNAGRPIEVVQELMQQFDLKHAADPLLGQPLSLTDALRESPMQSRREMVVQYWETVNAWCRCRAAEAAVQEYSRLPRATNGSDQALIAGAEQIAVNHWRKCQIELTKQQVKLQSFLPVSGQSSMLPLPSDLPLMQTYETQHEQFSGLRSQDGLIQAAHLILPQQFQLMLDRGQAVQLTGNSSQMILSALSSGQATWPQWLAAESMYQNSVQELIGTVIEYNQLIARYSLTVAPMGQAPEVAVAMLIVPEKSSQLPGGLDSGVRQASLQDHTTLPVGTGNGPYNQTNFGGNTGGGFQATPSNSQFQPSSPPAAAQFGNPSTAPFQPQLNSAPPATSNRSFPPNNQPADQRPRNEFNSAPAVSSFAGGTNSFGANSTAPQPPATNPNFGNGTMGVNPNAQPSSPTLTPLGPSAGNPQQGGTGNVGGGTGNVGGNFGSSRLGSPPPAANPPATNPAFGSPQFGSPATGSGGSTGNSHNLGDFTPPSKPTNANGGN